MPTHARTGAALPPSIDAEDELEQHMGALGLSEGNRLFLRKLHLAEKQLNDAFELAHRTGNLQSKVSQIYRELYRAD